jgi:hypothetical protein
MIAIACLAIPLAILVAMKRRVAYFVQTAEYHRKEATRLQRRTLVAQKSTKGMAQDKAAGLFEAEYYHRRMANKYRADASHPWLPVELDPPPAKP